MKYKKILASLVFVFLIFGCDNIQKNIDKQIDKQIQKVDSLVNKQIDSQFKKFDTLIKTNKRK